MKSISLDLNEVQQLVNFFKGVGPILEKQADVENTIRKNAKSILNILEKAGKISSREKNASANSLIRNPSATLDALISAVGDIAVRQIGKSAEAISHNKETADEVFLRRLMGC